MFVECSSSCFLRSAVNMSRPEAARYCYRSVNACGIVNDQKAAQSNESKSRSPIKQVHSPLFVLTRVAQTECKPCSQQHCLLFCLNRGRDLNTTQSSHFPVQSKTSTRGRPMMENPIFVLYLLKMKTREIRYAESYTDENLTMQKIIVAFTLNILQCRDFPSYMSIRPSGFHSGSTSPYHGTALLEYSFQAPRPR